MVKIEDVARAAGVSVATVSRVLNETGRVLPDTEARVREAVARLSYEPNLSARNLRKNESRIILILAPNFSNPYYSNVLAGICDVSRNLGYSTLIYNTYDSDALDESLVESLFQKNRADGMITLACNRDDRWLESYASRYPLVQCSEYVEGAQIPHISVDNRAAARDTVSHLVSLGHRRIGIVTSANRYLSSADRLRGYRDALEEAGIDPDDSLVAYASADYSFASGKQAARTLLEAADPPSAVFCVSDILALGVIAAAGKLGLQVPWDLSVAGFDDVDYTTMFHPYLTTVAVPCYELGRGSMLMLYDHIQQKPGAQSEVYLPHKIVLRESAAQKTDRTRSNTD
ncbi:MAG: LacI family transcriptional regulator [Clostridiales bacterium]|nr:LacI family transcriptional regulator [Clostridiales bacterium]